MVFYQSAALWDCLCALYACVPTVNRTLRSKRLGDLLAAHSSHASTDAAVLDEDATVLDRPSLIAAVTTHTQAVTDSRIAVAKALSEDVGKECAMQ